MTLRVMVLRGFGFNCEEETEAAYRLLHAQPEVVHVEAWLSGKVTLQSFDLLHVPGGFSFGDELGSGQVLANRLRHGSAWRDVERFLARKGRILGICNGFQVLVRTGLVPNLSGHFKPEVSLAPNAFSGFVDRWVKCQSPSGRRFEFPIRHGEGRLVFENDAVQARASDLVTLRYVDEAGVPSENANPNGSTLNAAALRSADGLVYGMMPHPEAFLTPYNHPAWAMRARHDAGFLHRAPDGLAFLRTFVENEVP